jgi:hypothetical protein
MEAYADTQAEKDGNAPVFPAFSQIRGKINGTVQNRT